MEVVLLIFHEWPQLFYKYLHRQEKHFFMDGKYRILGRLVEHE